MQVFVSCEVRNVKTNSRWPHLSETANCETVDTDGEYVFYDVLGGFPPNQQKVSDFFAHTLLTGGVY